MIRTNIQQRNRKYYSRYVWYYLKRNTVLLAAAVMFLLGVLLGSLFAKSADTQMMEILSRIFAGFVSRRREQGFLLNFVSGAIPSLMFLGILFVCGFCAISQPLVLLLPLFRGLGFGFSAASLYMTHGIRAAGFIALFILPDMVLSTMAILLCCRESLRLSGSFWRVLRGSGNGGEAYSIQVYVGRFIAAGVLCLFSSLVEAVLYFAFANYLVLG